MMTMLKKISYYYFLLILFALPFLSTNRLSAQRLAPVTPDSLAVVHYEDDTLYIASDSTFISLFFNKLQLFAFGIFFFLFIIAFCIKSKIF